MKVAMPLAKNVLAPLGLTAAMPAIDESIKKRCTVQAQVQVQAQTIALLH